MAFDTKGTYGDNPPHYPSYSYAANLDLPTLSPEHFRIDHSYRRWTVDDADSHSSRVSQQTFASNNDGATTPQVLPRAASTQPHLEKPLPPTPTSEYDAASDSSPRVKSTSRSTLSLPFKNLLRNVRRASFGRNTDHNISKPAKRRKAVKDRSRSPTEPQRIIYAEKGTQTSFEFLPTAMMTPQGQQTQAHRRPGPSSSSDESLITHALSTIAESSGRDEQEGQRITPTASRPQVGRSMKTFLQTSPSNPGTPSPDSRHEPLSFIDLGAVSKATSTDPRVDPVMPNAAVSPSSIHTVVRKPDSHDTLDSYDSYYSDTVAPAPNIRAGSGQAVTAQGITDRPIINRRAASDSTWAMTRDERPQRARGVSEDSVPLGPASAPIVAATKPRAIIPTKSPQSRQHLLRGTSNVRLSPLRNVQVTSPVLEHGQGLSGRRKPAELVLLPTSGPTPMQMDDLDKRSPLIFRRPIDGYFGIPPVDVNAVPDHLQTSFMCPLHPRHRGGQETYCSLHGHLDDTKAKTSLPSNEADRRNSDSKNTLSSSESQGSDDLSEFHAFIAPGPSSPSRVPNSPAGSPHSSSVLADLGLGTSKAARILMGDGGVPGNGDASRFELAGPDHQAGDATCPAKSGKGVCVWHGRVQDGTVRAMPAIDNPVTRLIDGRRGSASKSAKEMRRFT